MNELPAGWSIFTLRDLGGLSGGKTPSKANAEFWSNRDVPWVSPKDMKRDLLEDAEDRISQVAIYEAGMTLYPAGSVLMVTRSGILQHTFPVALAGAELTVNQDIKVLRPVDGITPKFAFYLLKGLGRRILSACAKDGTTVQSIDSEKLETFPLPLPSTAEQTRIAAKLDELLAQVDTLKARIDGIPAQLKRFRQSVLAAAVSGRLTEDWRTTNRVEPIDLDTLEDVPRTRRGVPAKVKRPDFLDDLQAPESWVWASAAMLLRKGVFVDLKDGNHGANHPKSSEFTSEGLPFITAANVSNSGMVDYLNAPKVSGDALARLRVGFSEPGDVIFTHKGTVGRVAINTMNCVLTPQTTYYRLNQNFLLSEYLSLYLQSNRFCIQADEVKSQTTRDFIPITAQYELFHLLPPVLEQSVIVRRMEQLLSFADQLEKKVNEARTRIDRLSQSILAKAFRGELVSQDPIDEPASTLLERIRASRAATPKTRRGSKALT